MGVSYCYSEVINWLPSGIYLAKSEMMKGE
jgi:hypothetical protein